MMYRLRFRSLEDAGRAEQVLNEMGGYTSLPGGAIAVPERWLPEVTQVLERNGIEYRAEEVEQFLGGRAAEEERD